MENNSNIIIYISNDGKINIDVIIENETVWLNQIQIAELFEKSKSTINEHILNIFKEGELIEEQVTRKIGISDFSTKPTTFYNLDVSYEDALKKAHEEYNKYISKTLTPAERDYVEIINSEIKKLN